MHDFYMLTLINTACVSRDQNLGFTSVRHVPYHWTTSPDPINILTCDCMEKKVNLQRAAVYPILTILCSDSATTKVNLNKRKQCKTLICSCNFTNKVEVAYICFGEYCNRYIFAFGWFCYLTKSVPMEKNEFIKCGSTPDLFFFRYIFSMVRNKQWQWSTPEFLGVVRN